MIVLQPPLAADETRSLAERACAAATRRGLPVLLAVTRGAASLDALALYRRAVQSGHDATYWEQPSQGSVAVTAGPLHDVVIRGDGRFAHTAAAWREIAASAITNRKDALVAFAGFSFATPAERAEHWHAFGDGSLTVPALTYRSTGGRAEITLAAVVPPGQSTNDITFAIASLLDGDDEPQRPDRQAGPATTQDSCDVTQWKTSVEAITAAIDAGTVEKAVLAREVMLHGDPTFDATAAIERLREGYPSCTLFAFQRDGTCFLGATPERLVRVDGRKVYASCLAGTARRGRDDADDAAIASALRCDEKERREHEVVVRLIRNALAPLCADICVPSEPSIMTMPNVLHLHTPIEGTLRAHADVLDIVERLHPTPAVGGIPIEPALAFIARHERFDRGWYAGPVGWIDANGNGEFAVALRSALVRGSEARLFAGCGIVAGSDPEREYDESALKLRPMLWALGQEQASTVKQQRDER